MQNGPCSAKPGPFWCLRSLLYWPELLVLEELEPPVPVLLLDVPLLVVPPVAAPPAVLFVPPVAAPLPAAKARLLDAANAAASINVLIFMIFPLRLIDAVSSEMPPWHSCKRLAVSPSCF